MAWEPPRKITGLIVAAIPALTSLLMILASLVPVTGRALGPITPPLLLIAVFFWAVHRPAHLPPWAAFIAGLSYDLLSGAYLGLWAFIATLTSAYGLSQRKSVVTGGFFLGWLAFIVAASVVGVLSWGLVSLLSLAVFPQQQIIYSTLLLIGLYPPISFMFGKLQQWGLRFG